MSRQSYNYPDDSLYKMAAAAALEKIPHAPDLSLTEDRLATALIRAMKVLKDAEVEGSDFEAALSGMLALTREVIKNGEAGFKTQSLRLLRLVKAQTNRSAPDVRFLNAVESAIKAMGEGLGFPVHEPRFRHRHSGPKGGEEPQR